MRVMFYFKAHELEHVSDDPFLPTGVFVVQGVRVGGGGASFMCGIAGQCPGSSDASNPGVHMVFTDPRGNAAQGLPLPEHLDASQKYPL